MRTNTVMGALCLYLLLSVDLCLYWPKKNITPYQPVYFLVGTDPGKSKFQISFKYRFFDADSLFAKSNPWVKGLNFGYTQTSFWDLKSASAPFDISFPHHKLFGDALDVYFYAQYTNMLAESLLDYQQRTHAVRLGLSFIR